MFSFFNKNKENNIFLYLKDFEIVEKNLLKNLKMVSGEWFVSGQIQQKIEKILLPEINNFEKYSKELDREESFRLEKKLDKKIKKLELRIKKLISQIERNIKELNKREHKEILQETYQIMKLFIDDLHQFILELKHFPFNNLELSIQKKILEDLRKKRVFLPDINFYESKEMIKKYTDEELILVLQYLSLEKPYLFITKDKFNNINRFILKMYKNSCKLSNKNFIISKFLGYFDIRNYGVKYEYKYYNNLKKYELKEFISFVEGDCLINSDIFRLEEDIKKYAYFLGAIVATGYFINLSDRLVNIHFNRIDFNKIDFNYRKEFLGIRNPLFHIDYDFSVFNSIKQYFTDIIFRSSYSLYTDLLFDKVDLNVCSINIVRDLFLEGYNDSIIRLRNMYLYNKDNINLFIEKNSSFKNSIKRLEEEYLILFKKIEEEKFKLYLSNL